MDYDGFFDSWFCLGLTKLLSNFLNMVNDDNFDILKMDYDNPKLTKIWTFIQTNHDCATGQPLFLFTSEFYIFSCRWRWMACGPKKVGTHSWPTKCKQIIGQAVYTPCNSLIHKLQATTSLAHARKDSQHQIRVI